MSEERFDTDAIVDVYEHLLRNDKPWLELICDQGLEGYRVKRALEAIFPKGDGRTNIAIQAFALGAQFGAMRLEPVEYDAKRGDTCFCFLCTIRRNAEAEAAKAEEDGGADEPAS